ncbi:MAG: restriction endonuclease subunit S, partial [Pseudomonadota bacterium]
MSDLPAGWIRTTLGEVGEWSSGGTPSRKNSAYFGGDIPWVMTGDLRDKEISDVAGRITEDGLRNSSAKIFPAGTLLVAMYGATIGRTGLLRVPAATNQACAALLANGYTKD